MNDPINPDHYKRGGIECIDVIETVVDEPLSYCIGNALKYLFRAGRKGDPVEDLKKAIWYIERGIRHLETKK